MKEEWSAGTAEDLVKDVHDLGVSIRSRTVTDYVEAGLLAPPLYRKSTQRGSDRRVFPPEQRQLSYELRVRNSAHRCRVSRTGR